MRRRGALPPRRMQGCHKVQRPRGGRAQHRGRGQGRDLAIRGEQHRVAFDGQGQDPALGPGEEGEAVGGVRRYEQHQRLAGLSVQPDRRMPVCQEKDLCQRRMAVGRDPPVQPCRPIANAFHVQSVGKGRAFTMELPSGEGGVIMSGQPDPLSSSIQAVFVPSQYRLQSWMRREDHADTGSHHRRGGLRG